MVGETLNDYVQRVRLEKSFQKLTTNRDKPITCIALECGFSSSQNFARLFKAYYGVTPSDVRREFHWMEWKNKMLRLKDREHKELAPVEAYLHDIYSNKRRVSIENILDKKPVDRIEICDMPDLRVAYVRTFGSYTKERLSPAFRVLLRWAGAKGLVTPGTKILSIWNNPRSVPEDKLIHDACITVDDSIRADKWVDVQVLSGGKYAVCRCETKPDQWEEAWLRFVLNWLATSDYQPDDRPPYQIYLKMPESHREKLYLLDLYMPVRSLFE
jgi:AraC family transcriptional regulator